MSGLLQAVKGAIGSFVTLIREDGQSEECELVAPGGGAGLLRKVASGTDLVLAFGMKDLGPFSINPDEAPTVLVYLPSDVGQVSSWSDGEVYWQLVTVGGDDLTLRLVNTRGSDITARWVLVAATV